MNCADGPFSRLYWFSVRPNSFVSTPDCVVTYGKHLASVDFLDDAAFREPPQEHGPSIHKSTSNISPLGEVGGAPDDSSSDESSVAEEIDPYRSGDAAR